MSIFFILGAGASVDSGLCTYRGANSKIKNYDDIMELLNNDNWDKNKICVWNYLEKFNEDIKKCELGETYKLINEIYKYYPKSFVLTQNIDGLINKIDIPSVEIHGNLKKMKCLKCEKIYDINFRDTYCDCGEICKPNIVLYNENLEEEKLHKLYKLIKKNRPSYLVVIGTTMQFPYLETIIKKTGIPKNNRYHMNPNISYSLDKKEKKICLNSDEGLKELIKIIKI
jgi:NAD-dependent deacetylase